MHKKECMVSLAGNRARASNPLSMGAKGGGQMRIYILRRTLGDAERAQAQIRARGADRVVGLAAGGRVDEEALRRSGADLFVLDAVLPGQDRRPFGLRVHTSAALHGWPRKNALASKRFCSW